MKYLYVVGLEHSGTTLVSHLLGQHPNFIALGEVAAYFSKDHMEQYLRAWGEYSDSNLCSCGDEWDQCEFWGELAFLSGHNSKTTSVIEKYKELFNHVRLKYDSETVLVDSSKSIATLKLLIAHREELGIEIDDFFVVYAVKDVRNFSTSIGRKVDNKNTVLANYRSFNWWLYENREIIKFLRQSGIRFWLNLYDTFCDNVDLSLRLQLETFGYKAIENVDVKHSMSHIVMGNKNFTSRNRNSVTYDNRWQQNLSAKVAYLLHHKARSLNGWLYNYENSRVKR